MIKTNLKMNFSGLTKTDIYKASIVRRPCCNLQDTDNQVGDYYALSFDACLATSKEISRINTWSVACCSRIDQRPHDRDRKQTIAAGLED
ncbi:hypothetical protein OK016_08905 [Vibrio chagasii]|nr:hypothetical protein [Vibrio chagasii]